ncbi:MAG: electron transfer flavoprotein subunit beta/FixA family protein [candidate division Zixibacteria bacterium]|nr:electron transfer flavoprotein subunit beta/FixA family protein [candidate division Zixibacteria bacterium]
MHIVVCCKQVPEIAGIKVAPDGSGVLPPPGGGMVNPFDVYAIEEGVRIKEKTSGKLSVISSGGPTGEAGLREALALGADEAYLLSDPLFLTADPLRTALVLAAGIKKIGAFDLVLCGKQAVDDDSSAVPAALAQNLELPQVIFVKKFEELQPKMAKVFRMTDDGYEVVETSLPAVVGVVKEINEPRLPSLKGKMRAKSAKVTTWSAADLELDAQALNPSGFGYKVEQFYPPPPRPKGEMLTGTPEEIAEKLFQKLRQAQVI